MTSDLQVLSDYIRSELGYENSIDPDADLLEEGILDSFSIVQVAAFIQERFEIELEPEDVVRENLSRLSSMAALIDRRRNVAE